MIQDDLTRQLLQRVREMERRLGIQETVEFGASHTHTAYSGTAHTHTDYSGTAHTHTAYSGTAHAHTDYSGTAHTHTDYSGTAHTHTAYSGTAHSHSHATLTNLTADDHTQYVPIVGNREMTGPLGFSGAAASLRSGGNLNLILDYDNDNTGTEVGIYHNGTAVASATKVMSFSDTGVIAAGGAAGLALQDDGGNEGLTILDGGEVRVKGGGYLSGVGKTARYSKNIGDNAVTAVFYLAATGNVSCFVKIKLNLRSAVDGGYVSLAEEWIASCSSYSTTSTRSAVTLLNRAKAASVSAGYADIGNATVTTFDSAGSKTITFYVQSDHTGSSASTVVVDVAVELQAADLSAWSINAS